MRQPTGGRCRSDGAQRARCGLEILVGDIGKQAFVHWL
jgi:hypothetical protein